MIFLPGGPLALACALLCFASTFFLPRKLVSCWVALESRVELMSGNC